MNNNRQGHPLYNRKASIPAIVVHNLKPGETPGYSASHRLQTMYNVLKYHKTFPTDRCGYSSVVVIFSIDLDSVLYLAFGVLL